MKKLLVLAAVVCLALFSCKKGTGEDDPNDPANQNLAPTTPMNIVGVLEDFTGVRCGYCPDGHVRAKAIEDANPGKFIIIADHSGGYAAPAAGWANFTSSGGKAVHDQANPAGYPAGTINRMTCLSLGVNPMDPARSNMTMDRGQWVKAVAKVIAMPSPVNIGAKAVYDAAAKELAITYELYYTADETVPNSVNIAILQSNLFSKQSGGTPDPNKYEQKHVLRELPLGDWGEVITSPTTKGSRVKYKTYYYAVPDFYNGSNAITGGGAGVAKDMKVVIFVTRGKKEIISALKVDIN